MLWFVKSECKNLKLHWSFPQKSDTLSMCAQLARGPICWGPICHSPKMRGAQFTAKSARGPICLEPFYQCFPCNLQQFPNVLQKYFLKPKLWIVVAWIVSLASDRTYSKSSCGANNFVPSVMVCGSSHCFILGWSLYDSRSKAGREDVAKKGLGRARCDWGVIRLSHDPPDTSTLCIVTCSAWNVAQHQKVPKLPQREITE